MQVKTLLNIHLVAPLNSSRRPTIKLKEAHI